MIHHGQMSIDGILTYVINNFYLSSAKRANDQVFIIV